MLIGIVGNDGTGKSTLIQSINHELITKNKKTTICSPWDTLTKLSKTTTETLTKVHIQQYLQSCSSLSRLYFLYHACLQALIDSQNNEFDCLLVDSYWYKYAIAESLQGTPMHTCIDLARCLPKLDLVFYLALDPKEALSRKKIIGLSRYETGGHEGKKGEDYFLKSQQKSIALWQKIKKDNWHTIDASVSINELTKIILAKV